MLELSHNWRIPKRGDTKGWQDLEAAVNKNRTAKISLKPVKVPA